MIVDSLANAAAAMNGTLLGLGGRFRGVSTDTRTLRAGELFFALHGPNFDGGAFVEQAARSGAAAAVVQSRTETELPLISVGDTRTALGRLASAWRRQCGVTVVGLTGSNGKTTLKTFIANCLSTVAPTCATRGNLNNDIGVPLTLSEIGPEHRFAVIEMGANHAGEIAALTALAEPHVVVITNAAPAHLEGFGSIEGVARAKGEILAGEPRPRRAVLNADDAFLPLWADLAKDIEVLTFGFGENADVRAVDVETTGSGSTFRLLIGRRELTVALRLPGRHNVLHACAAAAVADSLGIDDKSIRSGLEATEPVAGRLNSFPGIGGATIYDDSYNANPASVVAAAELVAAKPGISWLVLGDMGELGPDSESLHHGVGEAARKAGVARLFATGTLMRHAVEAFGANGTWFDSVETLVDALREEATGETNILVKGSRAAHMERVVHALRADESTRRRKG